VVTNGPREIMLIAELSGEGETWLGNSHFTLSADGNALPAVDHTGKPFVRYRCHARLAGRTVRRPSLIYQ